MTCCVRVDQHRGECNYWLVPLTYKSIIKPRIEMIMNEEILGRTIASGFSREETKNFSKRN